MTPWCLIPNLILYGLASLCFLSLPFGGPLQERRRFRLADVGVVLTAFGALLHFIYLVYLAFDHRFPFFAFVAWGLILMFLLFARRGGGQGLGAIFVPLSFILFLLSLGGATSFYPFAGLSALIFLHVTLSGLTFLFMLGNLCLGAAFWVHERQLKQKRWNSFMWSLPPLLVNEKVALSWLRIGFVWLTLLLISGALFTRQEILQTKQWVHIGLALASWILYALVLFRRWMGPHGRKILLLSLLGFVSLAASYLWT